MTPWTVQPMVFSRPEYWSGYPFPSPSDLPNPGIEPRSPTLQADSLPAESQGKPILLAMSATDWHLPWALPSTSRRIKSCAAAAADLQQPNKEFRVESRNKALCAQGKTGRTGLQTVRYARELII